MQDYAEVIRHKSVRKKLNLQLVADQARRDDMIQQHEANRLYSKTSRNTLPDIQRKESIEILRACSNENKQNPIVALQEIKKGSQEEEKLPSITSNVKVSQSSSDLSEKCRLILPQMTKCYSVSQLKQERQQDCHVQSEVQSHSRLQAGKRNLPMSKLRTKVMVRKGKLQDQIQSPHIDQRKSDKGKTSTEQSPMKLYKQKSPSKLVQAICSPIRMSSEHMLKNKKNNLYTMSKGSLTARINEKSHTKDRNQQDENGKKITAETYLDIQFNKDKGKMLCYELLSRKVKIEIEKELLKQSKLQSDPQNEVIDMCQYEENKSILRKILQIDESPSSIVDEGSML